MANNSISYPSLRLLTDWVVWAIRSLGLAIGLLGLLDYWVYWIIGAIELLGLLAIGDRLLLDFCFSDLHVLLFKSLSFCSAVASGDFGRRTVILLGH